MSELFALDSVVPSKTCPPVKTNRSLRRWLAWFTFTVAAAVLLVGVLQGLGTNWKVARPVRMLTSTKSHIANTMIPQRGGQQITNRETRKHPKPNLQSRMSGRYKEQLARMNKMLRVLKSTSRNLTQVEITRSIRNHTVQAICQADHISDVWMLDPATRQKLTHQIIVDDQRKFLYCYVPKVACSNWKRVIKFMQGTIQDIRANFKMDHKNDLVFLDRFSAEEIRYRLKNYYKFMIVRDPTQRLLSAFRNKFNETNVKNFKTRLAPRIIQKYRKGGWDGKSTSITLKEFVKFLLDSDPVRMDEHWKPMHLLCQPCAVQYDFIGSFEHLEEDSNYVLERIKGDTGAYFPPRQSWYNPTTEDKVETLLNDLGPVYIQQYVDKYILDFITFGYAPPKQYYMYLKHDQVSNREETSDNEVDHDGIEAS